MALAYEERPHRRHKLDLRSTQRATTTRGFSTRCLSLHFSGEFTHSPLVASSLVHGGIEREMVPKESAFQIVVQSQGDYTQDLPSPETIGAQF